jgi:PQQ-dependent catabolism-associated CXXCW motif protein
MMPKRRLLLLGAITVLSGCQSIDQAWESSKTTVGGLFDSPPATSDTPSMAPAAPRPAATGVDYGVAPVRSSATLASFDVPEQPYADEATDFGTPPVSSLIPTNYRAPTPVTLAGGRLIDTDDLHEWMISDNPPLVINAQPGNATDLIPGSIWMSGAGSHGNIRDANQQRLSERLATQTEGDLDRPIVFYCSGYNCWAAYNAALRTVNLDYRKVYWYRGGLTSWFSAGLPAETTRNDLW